MNSGADFSAAQGSFHRIRTALWHLRYGGPTQMRRYMRRHTRQTGATAVNNSSSGTLTFPEAELPTEWSVAFADVTVATILDDFSTLAFGYEWNQVPLCRLSWRAQLDEHRPDLLFVESAWHGNDDQWQYQLTGTSGVKEPFKELMRECRQRGIPTVFWNKEDPPHYDDFLECATFFDYVFTTDVNRVENYRADLGHNRVGVLAFAAQPAVHSPARPHHGFRERDVAFGGTYFAHKFPQRREQMNLLLGGAADVSSKMPHGLEIFSRYLGDDDRYQFPEPLNERVVGSLNYRQMLTAYQAYKVFLSVSSVVDSPSMCPRRVFEIISRGTPVVSTASTAVGEYFPSDELPTVHDRQSAANMVRILVRSPEFADRMVRKAQRRIWDEHTYTHRAAQVLTAALGNRPDGSGWIPPTPAVSVVLCTNRPHNLRSALQTVGAQLNVNVELVLVCHGLDLVDHDVMRLARAQGITNIRLVHAPEQWTLGEAFNAGVQASSAPVVTKMDDDDWYGPHYLHDQLTMLRVTGADIVGKQASYLYVKSYDVTVLRFADHEHQWTDFVLGPTLMAHRHVFETLPFEPRTRGEDTAFLRAAVRAGYRIYASDRFNFRQFRGSDDHTWTIGDQHILSTGVVTSVGDWLEHICL